MAATDFSEIYAAYPILASGAFDSETKLPKEFKRSPELPCQLYFLEEDKQTYVHIAFVNHERKLTHRCLRLNELAKRKLKKVASLEELIKNAFKTVVAFDFDRTLTLVHMWRRAGISPARNAIPTKALLDTLRELESQYILVVSTNNFDDVVHRHLKQWGWSDFAYFTSFFHRGMNTKGKAGPLAEFRQRMLAKPNEGDCLSVKSLVENNMAIAVQQTFLVDDTLTARDRRELVSHRILSIKVQEHGAGHIRQLCALLGYRFPLKLDFESLEQSLLEAPDILSKQNLIDIFEVDEAFSSPFFESFSKALADNNYDKEDPKFHKIVLLVSSYVKYDLSGPGLSKERLINLLNDLKPYLFTPRLSAGNSPVRAHDYPTPKPRSLRASIS